jgi:hypothetical protein
LKGKKGKKKRRENKDSDQNYSTEIVVKEAQSCMYSSD